MSNIHNVIIVSEKNQFFDSIRSAFPIQDEQTIAAMHPSEKAFFIVGKLASCAIHITSYAIEIASDIIPPLYHGLTKLTFSAIDLGQYAAHSATEYYNSYTQPQVIAHGEITQTTSDVM